jgi:hypothetical protein
MTTLLQARAAADTLRRSAFTGYRCSCDPEKVWTRSWV